MKRNENGDGLTVWTDATEGLDPDPWCTSPEPAQPDIIVVQADITEEKS